MDFQVYRSDDGRAMVRSSSGDFVASYKYGEWVGHVAFDRNEISEMPLVDDDMEAAGIITAARRALSRC